MSATVTSATVTFGALGPGSRDGAMEQRSIIMGWAPMLLGSCRGLTGNMKVYIIRMDFLTVELRAQEQSFSIIYY